MEDQSSAEKNGFVLSCRKAGKEVRVEENQERFSTQFNIILCPKLPK